MEELRKILEACFDRLQKLDIQPTLANMEILVQTLYDLRELYEKLGGEKDGGTTADPVRQDDH